MISQTEKLKIPQAVDDEIIIIGSLLCDPKMIPNIEAVVSAKDFWLQKHRVIYNVVINLQDEGAGDPRGFLLRVRDRLKDLGLLDEAGGNEYLTRLVECEGSEFTARHCGERIRGRAILRDLISAAHQITIEAGQSTDDPQIIIERAQEKIFNLSLNGRGSGTQSMGDVLQTVYDEIQQRQESPGPRGVPTKFSGLDHMLRGGGLLPKQLIIIAARPSVGKSALAVNMAMHIGIRQSVPVAIFSLEMSSGEVGQRLLSGLSGISSDRLEQRLSAGEFEDLANAIAQVTDKKIFINDVGRMDLAALRSEVRRLVSRHGVRVVFIDYLQLLDAEGENRTQEVTRLSRGLKQMAMDLNVTVMCLSQLNRELERRDDKRPRLSDLRDSGSIEQDADVVLMLHREDCFHRGDPNYRPDSLAQLIVAKQRNGRVGSVDLLFDEGATSFRNTTRF